MNAAMAQPGGNSVAVRSVLTSAQVLATTRAAGRAKARAKWPPEVAHVRGWFWNQFDHGEGYKRYAVKATDVPRIGAEFLQRQLEICGAYVFAAEYENCWQENEMTLISDDLVKAAMIDTGEKAWW
jgi:hypothetical protein